jgi:hypothetical protein
VSEPLPPIGFRTTDAARFGLIGALSGGLGYYLGLGLPVPIGNVFFLPTIANSPGTPVEAQLLCPGFTFGLIFALIFLVSGKLRGGGATAFAVTSAVGNYLAILAATAIMQLQPGSVHLVNENFAVAFWDQFVGICESYGVGGLLGGTILGGASMWLLRRTLRGTLRCATAGMLLGVVFGLITLADANFTLPLGFAIWQAGYAIVLATCVPRTSAFPRVNLGRFGRLLST